MATYYVWSGATGTADGLSWTNAVVSLDALFVAKTINASDIIYIASDHSNTRYTANKNFIFPESGSGAPVYLISTNRTSNLPEAGAIEGSNDFNIGLDGFLYCYGVTFSTGSGGAESNADFKIGLGSIFGNKLIFDSCQFIINSTSTGAIMTIAGAGGASEVIFSRCTLTTLNSASINILGVRAMFSKCVLSGGVARTTLFNVTSGAVFLYINGCDFSTSTNLIAISYYATLVNAVNSFLPANATTGTTYAGGSHIEFSSCGTGDHNYYYYLKRHEGAVSHNSSIYLNSGAVFKDNDGSSVNMSLMMTSNTSANACNKAFPLYSSWFFVPVFATGSKTFAVKLAHTRASVLNNNEAWIEVEYMGGNATANTPMIDIDSTQPYISGTKSFDILNAGSAMTDTAESWAGLTTPKTHTLSKTVTVNEQGWARVRVALAVNNLTIYVNPDVAVS